MLNQSIQIALDSYVNSDDLHADMLKALRNETEIMSEQIELGLLHLGEMMETLGNLANEKAQNFTHKAMSNDNVKHIGGLIQANAYMLYCLRNTTLQANDYLTGAK